MAWSCGCRRASTRGYQWRRFPRQVGKTWLQFEAIAAEPGAAFDQATLQNGREFLALVRACCAPAVAVEKGYWSTFRFLWPDFEVEVFDDHLEAYRHDRPAVDVSHFERAPGDALSADFMDMLPSR